MKKSVFFLVLLCLLSCKLFAAQAGNYAAYRFGYIGGNFGLTGRQVGYSRFALKVGGQFLYVWNYNSLRVSYNKLSVFHFDDDPQTKERYHAVELSLGRIFEIGDFRPLFIKNLSLSGSAGLSMNFIDYYKDMGDAIGNRSTSDRRFGIPLCFSLTNDVGSLFMTGIEYKHSILQRLVPSGEINFSISVKIFEL